MSIKVIDDFLDNDVFINIQNHFLDESMPWYTSRVLSYEDAKQSGLSEKENYQFAHLFYSNYAVRSNLIDIVNPIIEKINPIALVRIKANLNTKTERILEHGYHIDYPNITTAIYYINNNNGYTLFEDGTKVESKENRFVEFDSNLKHTGTSTTDNSFRILINFNYIK